MMMSVWKNTRKYHVYTSPGFLPLAQMCTVAQVEINLIGIAKAATLETLDSKSLCSKNA